MFTSQFKWMRDINETCFRLHEAGHFSFTSGYRLAVPILGTAPEAIHTIVLDRKAMLHEWYVDFTLFSVWRVICTLGHETFHLAET